MLALIILSRHCVNINQNCQNLFYQSLKATLRNGEHFGTNIINRFACSHVNPPVNTLAVHPLAVHPMAVNPLAVNHLAAL
jgi:hypothetical protein